MADAAATLQSLVVELSVADQEWLRERARRSGTSEAAELQALLRAAREREVRQEEARTQILEFLGEAARLEPGDEEAILCEIDGDT